MRELDFDSLHLEAAGLPAHPDDLPRHRLVGNGAVARLNHWSFDHRGRKSQLLAEPLVRAGPLLPVLADYNDTQAVPIFAMTQGAKQRLPKIKACLDWRADWFARPEPAAAARTQ